MMQGTPDRRRRRPTRAARRAPALTAPAALATLAAALTALACGPDEPSPDTLGARDNAAPAAVPAVGDTAATSPTDTTRAPDGGAPAGASARTEARTEARAATSPREARQLDQATRAAARQGATTRDTAPSGRVMAPPAERKVAERTPSSRDPGTPASSTGQTGAPTAAAASPSNTGAAGAVSPAQPAAPDTTADRLLASAAEYQGWKTFHVYCYRCHGPEAIGGSLAPDLRESVKGSVTRAVFITIVHDGRVEKGMPAWKELLNQEQIENLYAYVKARSDGRLAAGRPRQRQ